MLGQRLATEDSELKIVTGYMNLFNIFVVTQLNFGLLAINIHSKLRIYIQF